MIEQRGEAGKVIESKLQQISDELHSTLTQHIQVDILSICRRADMFLSSV